MKIRIGIITAHKSMRNFQTAHDAMRRLCDITYLPYSTTAELTSVYLENAGKFDGFLFSGLYPYDYLTENVCPITVPCRYLELSDRDIYRLIARMYAQNPAIDFSRVAFDIITRDAHSGTDIPLRQIFEDVFPPEKMPPADSPVTPQLYSRNLRFLHDAVFDQCRRRWQQGEVELFVTSLSNLAHRLEEAEMPHILLQPSRATIMDCFSALLADIQSSRIRNALTACCLVSTPQEEGSRALEQALEDFNTRENMVFVLRRGAEGFEAVTSGASEREITAERTTCRLTAWLRTLLPFPVHVGWGIGADIVTAHRNAQRALHQSQRDSRALTYLVSEAQEMIGPLGGEGTISYQIRPSALTSHTAAALGISAVNLEKLLSLQMKKGMAEVSAADLVFYLGITPRSASRILQKLCRSGGATRISSIHLNERGRPAAVYRLHLDRISL